MRIELDPDAFDVILLSTVEQFNHESIGLLFGYQFDDVISIALAYPLSHAHSDATEVTIDDDRIETLQKLYPSLRDQDKSYLGLYHSHPEMEGEKGAIAMSEFDRNAFMENNARIELIIAINIEDEIKEWQKHDSGIVTGSNLGYHFELAAYYIENGMIKRGQLEF